MTKKLLIDIIANDKTKAGLNLVQRRLKSVRQSVFSLKGALVGLGAGAVVKSFVDVGKEVESLQVRFKFLFGSVEEGQIAFDNLAKFAGRVPFSLEEISRASGNLAVVADDANDLNRILEITGNVAAVTGLDFETTSSQIQRAFSGGIGAADLFRERGVRALLGFQNGAKVTAEETVKRFEELFAGDGQFANATKDLATTLEGTISMIGDKYFNFQKDVATGFFDELKREFGDLNVFLEQNEQQIKDIATAIGENFAGAISTTSDLIKATAPSVKTIADALGTTIEGFKSLPGFVQTSGIIAALLFGKKGAIAFGAVSFLIGEIRELIKESELSTSVIDFGEASDVKELNEQLKILREERQALEDFVGTGDIIGDVDSSLSGETPEKRLATIKENINGIVERIRILNALNLEMGDAYSYASSQASDLKDVNDEIYKMAKQDASDYEKRQNSINKAVDAMNDKISALKNFADAYLPIQSVIIASKEEQEALNELVKQGGISAELAGIARQQIEMETYEKIKAIRDQQHQEELARKNEAIQKIEEEGSVLDILIQRYAQLANEFNANQLVADQFMTAVDGLNKALGDAVAQAVVFGKSFEDVFKSAVQNVLSQLISQLVQIGVQMLITKLLGDRLQDAAAKKNEAVMKQIAQNSAEAAALVSLATGGSNAIGAILGIAATYGSTKAIAARQNGGPVFAGQPVMVGETGKEMFVPQQNGEIIPNREIGQGTVINFNITANDTTDFDKLLVKRRGLIVGLINNALNEKGQGALV